MDLLTHGNGARWEFHTHKYTQNKERNEKCASVSSCPWQKMLTTKAINEWLHLHLVLQFECESFRILTFFLVSSFSRGIPLSVCSFFRGKHPHINESVHHHRLWRVQYITVIYLVGVFLWISCFVLFYDWTLVCFSPFSLSICLSDFFPIKIPTFFRCNAYFECSCIWPPSVSANVIHILSRLLKCKSSTVIIMHIKCSAVSVGMHTAKD